MHKTNSLTKTAVFENLSQLIDFQSHFARQNGMDDESVNDLTLAVEESLVNIIHYAYPKSQPGDIEIRCSFVSDKNSVIIEIRDRGVPFDPTATPEPDLEESLETRKVGGMGIFLVRKLTDEFLYRYEDGQNIITLIKKTVAEREGN